MHFVIVTERISDVYMPVNYKSIITFKHIYMVHNSEKGVAGFRQSVKIYNRLVRYIYAASNSSFKIRTAPLLYIMSVSGWCAQ